MNTTHSKTDAPIKYQALCLPAGKLPQVHGVQNKKSNECGMFFAVRNRRANSGAALNN